MYEIDEKCFKCVSFCNNAGECIGDKNACPEYAEYSEEKALRAITNHYNFKNQRNILCEECAELIQSVSKCLRYADNATEYRKHYQNFAEEVADVLIMCEQMRLYLGENLIDEIKESKLKRQLRRISNE